MDLFEDSAKSCWCGALGGGGGGGKSVERLGVGGGGGRGMWSE